MDKHAHAVIFDWDGTLADSEKLYVAVWRATLLTHNYELTTDDEQFLVGRAFPDSLANFAVRAELGPDGAFEAAWQAHFTELAINAIPLFPDAISCLRYVLDQEVCLAIATQSPRAQFDSSLSGVGLDRVIDVSVCRDEVALAKPAPDLYLEACRRIRKNPADCLAIEDSPIGAASARTAGLKVLGIARNPANADQLARESDRVVTVLTPAIIEEMFQHA